MWLCQGCGQRKEEDEEAGDVPHGEAGARGDHEEEQWAGVGEHHEQVGDTPEEFDEWTIQSQDTSEQQRYYY